MIIDDPLLAAVLAAGLAHKLVARDDVIRWADSEIERRTDIPAWLIDLSMSHQMHILDVVGILNRTAVDVPPVAVCRGIYSLMPELPADYTYDRYADFAEQLYQLTYDLLDGDWSIDLLRAADTARDNFDWVREGYGGLVGDRMVPMDESGVVLRLRAFLRYWSDQGVRDRLKPVRCLFP